MRNLTALITMFFFINSLSAQSKKDIKENKIESMSETVTEIINGKESTYKDTYTAFDKNGNVIEEILYNSDGTVKKRRTMEYDNEEGKNKMVEIEYEGKDGNTVLEKHQWTYNTIGDKIMEQTFDAVGNLIKKDIHTYNNKGLRVEKKIYDGKDVLKETHTFLYVK